MLPKHTTGGEKEQQGKRKGAHMRLFINLAILFVAWLASAILFSAKVSAQGLILTNQVGQEVEQSVLKSTHLDIQVKGMLAFVELKQVYQNPALETLNGSYQFPLPENSAVFAMEMMLDNRKIIGEIKEKQQAEVIYKKAQQQGHKAALVKNQSANVFKTKVANIEPGQEVAVKLSFQFPLTYQDEVFSLRLPTVVAPRYFNNLDLDENDPISHFQTRSQSSFQNNSLMAEEAPTLDFLQNTVLTSFNANNKITINFDVNLGFELDSITSPSHMLSVVQTGNTQYQLIPAPQSLVANRDFDIKFVPLLNEQITTQVFHENINGESFYKVMMMPPKSDFVSHSLPRELVFVIDTSGSMAGTSMEQAKQALILALEKLDTDDLFNIVAFDHEVELFQRGSVAATYSQLQAAKRFVAGLEADGGTEINSALAASFDGQFDETRVRQVVLLTDGAVADAESVKGLVKNRRADSKLFTIAIGSAPNSHLMRLLAKHGKGETLFINNLENIASEVSLLSDKLSNPALQNIRVLNDMGLPLAESLPTADLYFSSPLVAYFKLTQAAQAVQIAGDGLHGKFLKRVSLENAIAAKGITRAYAKEHINTLDLVQDKAEITKLGIRHGLLTPYTAFIAVEEYFGDVANKSFEAPNMLPQGSAMPQTSGNNDRLLWLGILLLVGGFLLAIWGQKEDSEK
ncbi:VIT domain-containing protein [Pseudoalteromonas spongiae]|uniref:VIT domain-containing protein n=1 Tax=Pseudoalteromonas spongiae TaxID=298657 RepID=UPI00026CBEE8|nr:VIT domain-containing protein [Pseudoalteromonas spongiae]ATC97797.1 Ca-activated chloride channel protein [Pseudoalteromonas spongiae UST010723-006]